MLRIGLALSFFGLTSGCTILADDDGAGGKADGFGDATCDLPAYGDGTCQSDLACAVPDIDCFLFFDSDAAGGAWFQKIEETIAAQELRPPRAQIAESDPRVQHMRELLDRGWEAYKQTNPVQDLGEHRPALVVLEDPTVNAFVMPDLESGNAGFAVMVQTGVLDLGLEDAPMLGLVMHELEHAVRLHVRPEVGDRIRRFYVADYREPLGFEELDDPVAREHGTAWRGFASEVGSFPAEDLGGLPLGGQLSQIFNNVMVAHAMDPGCAEPVAAFKAVVNDVAAAISPLDADIHLAEPIRPRVDAALAGLRDQCLPDFGDGFIDVVASIAGTSADEVRASLSAEDLAMVVDVHFVDAVAALAIDRRGKMRAAEAAFAAASGQAWDALRFYSTEEAADDATVPVLHQIPLDPEGLGAFFLLALLDPDSSASCSAILAGGDTPPYGADLSDEHHATCWRVHHVGAVADSGKLYPPTDDPAQYLRRPGAATAPAPRRPRLIPPRASDLIVY